MTRRTSSGASLNGRAFAVEDDGGDELAVFFAALFALFGKGTCFSSIDCSGESCIFFCRLQFQVEGFKSRKRAKQQKSEQNEENRIKKKKNDSSRLFFLLSRLFFSFCFPKL